MKKKLLALLFTSIFSLSLISCSKDVSKNNVLTNSPNNTPLSEDIESENQNNSNSNSNLNSSENNDLNIEEIKDEIITKNANIYYYDVVNDKIIYLQTNIEIKNKEVATALVNKLKKSPTDDIAPAINENIYLKSAKLDQANDVITLDFSSNFIEEQNLGGGTESSTLKAICNTFGDYFNVNKVIITLDGKPYSSGHIVKNEGEAFDVNLDIAEELKK